MKTPDKSDKQVHGSCAMCLGAPMQVRTRNGKIMGVEGENIPGLEGKICGKAIAGTGDRIYGPNRILHPLKRVGERGEAKFVKCTWDEVINAVAGKLKQYIDSGHPEYFEIWWGCPYQVDKVKFLHYWSAITKTGISYLHGQVCFGDHAAEKVITFGANHGPRLWLGISDMTRTKYAVIAGQNFPGTAMEGGGMCSIPTYLVANRAKQNGCQFLSVDPKLADTTPWCDEWVPIRPGTDAVFALHITHQLIKEKLYDEDFLLKYTNAPQLIREDNGQALKDPEGHYLCWDQDTRSAIPIPEAGKGTRGKLGLIGVFEVTLDGQKLRCKTAFQRLAEEAEKHKIDDPYLAQKTIEIARNLGTHKPSVIFFPGFTSGRYPNWFQAMRAYSVVNLLLGNFDRPGGFYFTKQMLKAGPGWPEPPEVPEYPEGLELVAAPFGNRMSVKNIDRESCYKDPPDFHPATVALPWLHFDAIEKGNIRALLSTAENSAVTQPNAKWVWECLKKLDLIIVGEQVPKEFVDLADYVIPEASYVERNQLFTTTYLGADQKEYSLAYMMSAAIPPQGDSKPVSWFLTEVAKKLGLGGYFEKLDVDNAWWDRILKQAGLYPEVTAQKLIEEGPYVKGYPMDFNILFMPITTPSGRFEIFSNDLAEVCYYNSKSKWYQNLHVYPLPTYIPIAKPKADDEFYLVCGKAVWHQKSATQNNRYLMEDTIEGDCPYTAIYLNAQRAEKLGIEDGDVVEVQCIGPTKQDDPCVYNDAVIGTKGTGKVKVTQGLHPDAAWVYFAAGHKSHSMLAKTREGLTHNWFIPSTVSPYAGGMGKNYSIVRIRKIHSTTEVGND